MQELIFFLPPATLNTGKTGDERRAENMLRWIVLLAATVAANLLFKVFNRLEVTGRPKRWPESAIFYANHRSAIDYFVILFGCLSCPLDAFLGRSPAVWIVGYAGLFSGWLRLFVRPCRIILRHDSWDLGELEGTVEEMSAVLRRGENLLIFPEGRRHLGESHADLVPFKRGLAWLVKRHKAQVIPVALAGTDALMPEGLCLPRLGRRVKVVFGDPVPSARWDGKSTAEITADLEKRLKALLRATA